jgi:capsular polysaccharide biosynthesis protein
MITKERKHKVLKKMVGDFKNKLSSRQLSRGIDIEQEHNGEVSQSTNITKGNQRKVAKIAVAHLKEIPDYYTRLDRMEREAKSKK